MARTGTKTAVTLTAAALVVGAASFAYGGPKNFSDADFKAELSGANEVPPVASDASGEAKFSLRGDTLAYELEFEDGTDLLGAAGAHIHCAPADANGPVVAFLAGPVAGGIDGDGEIKASLTDSNIINDACGATIAELAASLAAGDAYVNVHSTANPSGEIRGQVMPD